MHAEQGGIVTPEGVVLELDVAGLGSRALAKALDLVVLAVLAYVILFLIAGVVAFLPQAQVVAAIVSATTLLVGYPVLLETIGGKTVGKYALGLRVVTTDGAPIRFRHAAIRGLLGIAELFATLGAIAVLSALCTRNVQRFGDLAAGTLVIHERARSKRAAPVAFNAPPGWERYVASLDVGSLSPEQYGVIRSFLIRSSEFTPQARAALAIRVATPLVSQMRHQPPSQVSPELLLVCVATAYQLRHSRPTVPTP